MPSPIFSLTVPEKSKTPPKTRLNLDLTPKVRERLDDLQAKTDASSLVEVIRRALAVYDMFLDHERNGGKTVLQNADGSREIVKLLI